MPTEAEVEAGVLAIDEAHFDCADTKLLVTAILMAAEKLRPSEDSIRKEVNLKTAHALRTRANSVIRDFKSDGVDGYCAGVILDIANMLERNANDQK